MGKIPAVGYIVLQGTNRDLADMWYLCSYTVVSGGVLCQGRVLDCYTTWSLSLK